MWVGDVNVAVAAGTTTWWEVSASMIGLCTVCVLRSAVEAWARVVVRYYSQRQRLLPKMKTSVTNLEAFYNPCQMGLSSPHHENLPAQFDVYPHPVRTQNRYVLYRWKIMECVSFSNNGSHLSD